ncbi:MAG: hypothetical protein BECKG1743F_GA0114225_109113, partial [Candidatus Kentron sp. G]
MVKGGVKFEKYGRGATEFIAIPGKKDCLRRKKPLARPHGGGKIGIASDEYNRFRLIRMKNLEQPGSDCHIRFFFSMRAKCYGSRYFGGSVPHTGRGNRGTSR